MESSDGTTMGDSTAAGSSELVCPPQLRAFMNCAFWVSSCSCDMWVCRHKKELKIHTNGWWLETKPWVSWLFRLDSLWALRSNGPSRDLGAACPKEQILAAATLDQFEQPKLLLTFFFLAGAENKRGGICGSYRTTCLDVNDPSGSAGGCCLNSCAGQGWYFKTHLLWYDNRCSGGKVCCGYMHFRRK